MAYESDAEDIQLLREGDIAALLAKYEPLVRGRCIARLKGSLDAEDVAQNVMLRLLNELHRGKTYPVPFRVVVNQVTTWTIADYFEDRPTDVPLPEDWEPSAERESSAVESRDYLMDLFDDLPETTRAVLERPLHPRVRARGDRAELGMTTDAVYPRPHRARERTADRDQATRRRRRPLAMFSSGFRR